MKVKYSKKLKLKDRVENISDISFYTDTRNPVKNLSFKKDFKTNEVANPFWSKKIVVTLLAFSLIGISMLFNSVFPSKFDQYLINMITSPFVKPYVVTIGEYGNLQIAKSEAIELLDELKQIEIKELSPDLYIFELARFRTKDSADKYKKSLIQAGLNFVRIRYLPG